MDEHSFQSLARWIQDRAERREPVFWLIGEELLQLTAAEVRKLIEIQLAFNEGRGLWRDQIIEHLKSRGILRKQSGRWTIAGKYNDIGF